MHILAGIIGAILSVLIIVYRVPIRNFMGQIAWAEAKLGPGGTYTLLLLVGVLGFLISLMVMTDSFDLIFKGSTVNFFESVK